MELVRDCLDKLIVDPHGRPLGRADGIILNISERRQPQIAFLEIGPLTRLRRSSKTLTSLYQKLARVFGVLDVTSHRIPWQKAVSTSLEIVVAEDASESPALEFERWLKRKVIGKIPGN